jgi:hypothetical protein
MKKLQTLFAAVLCGAIFSTAASASAQNGQQGYGTVLRVSGLASYSLGDNDWHPLLAGKTLPVGSVVRTGDNGVVDVVLGQSVRMPQAAGQPDRISNAGDSPVRGLIGYEPSVQQNVVRLTPNTTLGIDKLTVTDTGADTVSDTELNLKQGRIFASVKKLSGSSQYLIKLPNGIAGVRGTLFSIGADGSTSVFESNGGGVVLSMVGTDGNPKTFLVSPGQSFDPASGQSSPLSAESIGALKGVFAALQTSYYQAVNFSYDYTQSYVSPTLGAHAHNQ